MCVSVGDDGISESSSSSLTSAIHTPHTLTHSTPLHGSTHHVSTFQRQQAACLRRRLVAGGWQRKPD